MDALRQKQIFDDWLNEHKGILFKITRAYAFNVQDQDDLFQEISLQLWQSIPSFRGDAKVSTWICRVALYTAAVWVRQEKKGPPTQPLASVEHTLVANSEPRDERLRWLSEQIGQLEPIGLCPTAQLPLLAARRKRDGTRLTLPGRLRPIT